MENYFPLSLQFNSQLSPSTCGPSTLTMVLNTLGIDPKIRWKGYINRYYNTLDIF